MVGIEKKVRTYLDKKVREWNFTVEKGSPDDVIVGYCTMKSMEGFLDPGNSAPYRIRMIPVASFVFNWDKIEIAMASEYV